MYKFRPMAMSKANNTRNLAGVMFLNESITVYVRVILRIRS